MSDLLLNARFLSRPATGVDRVATELADALLARASGPQLTAMRPKGEIAARQDRPARLIAATSQSPSRLKGQAWEQLALPRMAPDKWLLSLCNMGPILRRKQVVMIHDAQAFRQPESYSKAFRHWYHFAQPRLGHRADLVLTVSEHSKREIEHFGIAPKDKTKVIPNGADHVLRLKPDMSILAKNGLDSGCFLLAIGSLAPHKNLQFLVEAARARTNTRIPLVIAGGGNAQIFGDAGISASDDVRMLGRVTDAELRGLYDHATALVFPSLTEGFGLPPAEAMFCGCPVIASTGGAIPEVCGSSAWMLDPRDTAGWTSAMEDICADAALRDRLANSGRDHVQRFTWSAAADALVRCIHDFETP